jgi:hypothetical protein
MRRFKWIEWNLQKIAAHALSAEEVEAAFNRIIRLEKRRDGSFRMLAEVPPGRRVWVIWRYDRESDEIPDVFGEVEDTPIFVITAYEGDSHADTSARHPQ